MDTDRRPALTATPRPLRTRLLVGALAPVLAVSACASSTTGGAGVVAGSASASATSSAPASLSTSADSGAPASSGPDNSATAAPSGGRDVAKACADYAAIVKDSNQPDANGKTIENARTYAAQLVMRMTTLAADAPATISDAAHRLLRAVAIVKSYADKATSLEQLRAERDSDPVLKDANRELSVSGDQIEAWAKASCR